MILTVAMGELDYFLSITSLHGGIEVRAKRVARWRTNRKSRGLSDARYAYRYGSLDLRSRELPGV